MDLTLKLVLEILPELSRWRDRVIRAFGDDCSDVSISSLYPGIGDGDYWLVAVQVLYIGPQSTPSDALVEVVRRLRLALPEDMLRTWVAASVIRVRPSSVL
jgi:hypothetical protein